MVSAVEAHAGMPRRTGVRRGLVVAALTVLIATLPAVADAGAKKHRKKPARAPVAESPHAPALTSTAVVVLDAGQDTILYRRREDVVRPIASITKLMTAMVVVEAHQPLDEVLEVTSEDAEATKKSTSRLPVGAQLTRGELLHLALMASENRAANALARNYPGGFTACIAAMRRKAAELGMTRTFFVEPTGLSSENVSTSADLTKLVRAAAAVPAIQHYSTAPELVVKVRGRPMEFHNTNRLVHDENWDLVVQKTGYIREAGRCLVLETVMAGRQIVMVLLDSAGQASRIADARRLRKWLEKELASLPSPTHAAVTPVAFVEPVASFGADAN